MPHYYFDIETTGLDEKDDEIITIQYQKICVSTGEPIGRLSILKSWEFGEEGIIKQVESLMSGDPWEFVPVGNNLAFEFKFLAEKFRKYLNKNIDIEYFLKRPHVDLKSVMILANGGKFKGCHLVLGKKGIGMNVPTWYFEGRYDLIEDYIIDETTCFLEFVMNAQKALYQRFGGMRYD